MFKINSTKNLKLILIWIPSLLVAYIFLENGFTKIFYSNGMDKLGVSNTILIAVGFILIISVALFLYKKTLLYGAAILALYMTAIVFIHISKGKPFFLTFLIVLLTLFATYLRKTQLQL
tara:strand:+ start:117 stop:473 length:357 start_codon:yes stop_codon:yes gene_type:complete